jgi:hypothetical protein
MDALVNVVDHANKCIEANCSGWRDVISSANDQLTCRDIGRFAALCNNGHKSVEGEYYLYGNWQSLFLGCPTYIWIRNGVKSHEEVEGSNDVESNNESWGGSNKFTGGRKYFLAYHQWIAYFEWLLFCPEEAARYRQFKVCFMLLFFIALCQSVADKKCDSISTFIWWRPARDQGSW